CSVCQQRSFKNSRSVFCHASAADRDRIIEAWHHALTAAFARTEGLRPFDLACCRDITRNDASWVTPRQKLACCRDITRNDAYGTRRNGSTTAWTQKSRDARRAFPRG
ncbi:unnamed protein product, partial [Ectocarpus sp. 4 AP-2014]